MIKWIENHLIYYIYVCLWVNFWYYMGEFLVVGVLVGFWCVCGWLGGRSLWVWNVFVGEFWVLCG